MDLFRYKLVLRPSSFLGDLLGGVSLASLHVLRTVSSWAQAELLGEAFLELGFLYPQRLSFSPSPLAILILFGLARVFVSNMLAQLGAALKASVTPLASVVTGQRRQDGVCGSDGHPGVAAL